MLDTIRRMAADGRTRGWYAAAVTSVARSFQQVQIRPEWTKDALEHARRISSPILDIIPAVGTRVAVTSQDGVVEAPAVLGQLWDDTSKPDDMTAWLRAHLEDYPGQLELGAEKGLRVKVGDNTVDITPLDDGRLQIEATGTVVIDAPRIELGDGASDGVVRKSDLDAALNTVKATFNGHTHTVSGTAGTAPGPTFPVAGTTAQPPAMAVSANASTQSFTK